MILIAGAGFSYGCVPITKEIVKNTLCSFLSAQSANPVDPKVYWGKIARQAGDLVLSEEGLPMLDCPNNVQRAYQAAMTSNKVGLSTPELRTRFVRYLCEGANERLSLAVEYLASIIASQNSLPRPFCHLVLTSNFDKLIETALARNGIQCGVHRAIDKLDLSRSLMHVVHSHGCLDEYFLANTPDELEQAKGRVFDNSLDLSRHAVLVIGYSGWEDAIFSQLRAAREFAGNLYWCDICEESALRPEVRQFLAECPSARYVRTEADDLVVRLHKELGFGERPRLLQEVTRVLNDSLKPFLSLQVSQDRMANPLYRQLQEAAIDQIERMGGDLDIVATQACGYSMEWASHDDQELWDQVMTDLESGHHQAATMAIRSYESGNIATLQRSAMTEFLRAYGCLLNNRTAEAITRLGRVITNVKAGRRLTWLAFASRAQAENQAGRGGLALRDIKYCLNNSGDGDLELARLIHVISLESAGDGAKALEEIGRLCSGTPLMRKWRSSAHILHARLLLGSGRFQEAIAAAELGLPRTRNSTERDLARWVIRLSGTFSGSPRGMRRPA